MKRTLMHRRSSLASTLAQVVLALLLAVPAHAQGGGRMQVLVPAFEGEGRGNPGENIANSVRQALDQMPTHVAVTRNAVRDALRQLDLNERDMNCILWRQLAGQMTVPLVMCGSFEQTPEGLRVEARVISARSGEEFVIEPFTVSNPNQAGEHIRSAFQTYVEFLSAERDCADFVSSQIYDSALARCDRALALNPSAEAAKINKARALYETNRYQEALAILQEVLENNPYHQDVLLTAGLAAFRLGQEELGQKYFRDYMELDPANVPVRLQVARDLNTAGNPEGALLLTEDGFAHSPDDLTLVEYAGHFALNAAIQLLSTGGSAVVAVGNGSGTDQEKAMQLLDKAVGYYQRVYDEKGAESPDLVLRNMLRGLARLERFDAAAEFGAQAVQARPDDAEIWFAYADALRRGARYQEALGAFDRAKELNPELSVGVLRASVRLNMDDLEGAVAEYEQAIAAGETTADDAAYQIFAYGVTQKYQKDLQQESKPYLQAARRMAQSAERRGAPAYYLAIMAYREGDAIMQNDQSLAAAQRARPILTEAKEYITEAAAYTATDPRLQTSQRDIMNAVQQHLDIIDLIIQRGR